MVIKHLTDEEIQVLAFDKANHDSGLIEHITMCQECKLKVETYQLLFKGIIQQPGPVFEFDLPAVVLKQLPVVRGKPANDKLITWVFIFICAGLVATVLYFFRSFLNSMFKGIAGISIYLIVISAITILAMMFVEMYKSYQKEMRVLDPR